jgi:hypothetical protein
MYGLVHRQTNGKNRKKGMGWQNLFLEVIFWDALAQ